MLLTGQGDPAPHQAIAEEIADDTWARRHEALNQYLTVAQAAEIAAGWRTARWSIQRRRRRYERLPNQKVPRPIFPIDPI